MSDERSQVYAAIEEAIAAVGRAFFDDDEVITDAVLLVGAQHIDSDGDRMGRIRITPRGGCQPAYITIGLIECARQLMQASAEVES